MEQQARNAIARSEIDVHSTTASSLFDTAGGMQQYAQARAQQRVNALASGTTGTGVLEDSDRQFFDQLSFRSGNLMLQNEMIRLAGAQQQRAGLFNASAMRAQGKLGLLSGLTQAAGSAAFYGKEAGLIGK